MKINKNVINDVLKLALPAVGEMILYMMIWVFDTMMVGKYGGNLAVSSVGLSSEIMYTFSNILIAVGLSVGTTSLVARKVGAKHFEEAEEYSTLAFLVGLVISLIIFLLFFLLNDKILRVAGASEDVINLGAPYMKIASIGITFNMLMSVLNGVLRGYGNTIIPLVASILINIINITLDILLIFGYLGFPELGVSGAAIATSTAQVIGFIFILLYTLFKSPIKLKLKYILDFKSHMLSDLLKLSIPSAMQEGAFSISRLLSNFMIMSIGTVAFAANQITTTIESISFMPGWGFAVAATTLVGHKIGEKDYDKAKEYADTSIILGTITMLICSILFLIIPKQLINLFIKSSETEVIRLGSFCLIVAAFEQAPMAISMIVGGIFKGAGNTKTPFLVSLISSWIIRLPLIFYFIYVLESSVIYVWIITTIQWIFDGGLIYILFKKNFFKKRKLS